MQNYNPEHKSGHKELCFTKGDLQNVFTWELEVFDIVQPQLRKRAILLKTKEHWQN